MIETIGVLGGGQLGRMLTLEAKRMGYRIITLEPLPNSPCGQVADEQIVAAYDDLRAIGELGARSDIVTYEFENIPLQSVLALENAGRLVRPSGEVLRITQDRILEKTFMRDAECSVAPFAAVSDLASLDSAIAAIGVPAVIKTARGGYDGKGQWIVRSDADAREAFAAARGAALIYESFIPFDLEVSVICARDETGSIVCFPVTENVHDHGVLSTAIVPARIAPSIAEKVRATAVRIGERLAIVGAYCVEFFVFDGGIYGNEIAPRVHNTGHYSLDATQISQYEMHVRAICDLPLVEVKLWEPAVMANILGTGSGDHLVGVEQLLCDPDIKLHLYGKRHAGVRRKMGHFTALAPTVEEALAKVEKGRALLSWSANDSQRGLVKAVH
ncbi:MAG TPA: 5-(carboxyamino)imidazole ribonucleotide synthase [Candidatus Baltobacteraceae bacterium]|nr:5-(carboxyamino)imidazole ribonucleotide synthase [Candidatus Baltobacteraceae bacterium]